MELIQTELYASFLRDKSPENWHRIAVSLSMLDMAQTVIDNMEAEALNVHTPTESDD